MLVKLSRGTSGRGHILHTGQPGRTEAQGSTSEHPLDILPRAGKEPGQCFLLAVLITTTVGEDANDFRMFTGTVAKRLLQRSHALLVACPPSALGSCTHKLLFWKHVVQVLDLMAVASAVQI